MPHLQAGDAEPGELCDELAADPVDMRVRQRRDAAGGTQVRLAAGVAGLLVLGLLTKRLGRWFLALAREGTWRAVAMAAVIGTFLGIWAHIAALGWARHTGVASTLNALSPVFLIPLSIVFLGERSDARRWIATAVAMAGVALMALAR